MNLNDLIIGKVYVYINGKKFEYRGKSLKKDALYLFIPHPLPNPINPLALENGGILLTLEETLLFMNPKK